MVNMLFKGIVQHSELKTMLKKLDGKGKKALSDDVIIKFHKDKLTFTKAYHHMNVSFYLKVDNVEIDESLSIKVKFKGLLKLFNISDEEEVCIELTGYDNELKTYVNGMSVSIGYEVVEDENYYLSDGNQMLFSLSYDELASIINSVGFSIGKDYWTESLKGFHFINDSGELCVETSDARRLSRTLMGNVKLHSEFNFIVCAKILKALLKLMTAKDMKMTFYLNDNELYVEWSDGYVEIILIEANFPDFKKIIPVDFVYDWQIDGTELLNVLNVVKAIDDMVVLRCDDKGLYVENANKHEFSSSYQLQDVMVTGGNIEIALNVDFILDILRSTKASTVTIKANGEVLPVVVDVGNQSSLTYVVLPIKRY